eukprot:GHVT01072499.1.p2 GENE.GHVT01072499.1~~GHVT01072499.1.p2  ORF type:complete len:161 (+),score=25.57 GHVT01072499.1:255-737(+)
MRPLPLFLFFLMAQLAHFDILPASSCVLSEENNSNVMLQILRGRRLRKSGKGKDRKKKSTSFISAGPRRVAPNDDFLGNASSSTNSETTRHRSRTTLKILGALSIVAIPLTLITAILLLSMNRPKAKLPRPATTPKDAAIPELQTPSPSASAEQTGRSPQ